MTLALRGDFPTLEEKQALLSSGDPEAFLEQKLSDYLAEPSFYDRMLEVGRDWLLLPPLANIGDRPEYGLTQQRWLTECPEGTFHEGAWHNAFNGSNARPCNGLDLVLGDSSEPAPVADVEPWWAPGTTVRVVGRSAVLERTVGDVDCGHEVSSGGASDARIECGCGPNLIYCNPAGRWETFYIPNQDGQRRQMWEEPSRLFAHLAWYDRPLSDWITGTYTVGTRKVQAAYVRHGRRTGAAQLDGYEDWWRTDRWTSPADPHHEPTSPEAWSEFEISTRNPYFLSEREVRFDPRTDPPEAFRGVPAAGLLTSLGVNTSWARERVRAARLLEALACETFSPPPADQHFNEYVDDPGAQGPCQHCHSRIDPAAIHFKRFTRYGKDFLLLGAGQWHFPAEAWWNGRRPYHGDPWERIVRLWKPGTKMTPVSEQAANANPETIWIDYLPPDQTLLGERSDGTVGPLGFGKMLIASGRFDRCVARRLHEAVVGRDIDPVVEAGYLDTLAKSFVDGGRRVRPFVRSLVEGEVFARGIGSHVAGPPRPDPENVCPPDDLVETDRIRNGLAPHCAGCHSGGELGYFASLDAFVALLASDERLVRPGEPEASELVSLLEGRGSGTVTQMPLAGLPYAQIEDARLSMEEIRGWIRGLGEVKVDVSADRDAPTVRRLPAEFLNGPLLAKLGMEVDDVQRTSSSYGVEVRYSRPNDYAVLDPDAVPGPINPVNSAAHYGLGGGSAAESITEDAAPNATFVQFLVPLAQRWCERSVALTDSPLFEAAGPNVGADSPELVKADIQRLGLHFWSETLEAEQVDTLFDEVFVPMIEASGDVERAWVGLCSVFIRDPRFLFY